jgi:hypothetical protein
MLLASCTKDFSTPRYRKQNPFTGEWKRKRVLIVNTGTYRNPTVKSEARRAMLNPRSISLDDW